MRGNDNNTRLSADRRVDRRGFLKAGAGAAAGAGIARARTATGGTAAAIERLRQRVKGPVAAPGDSGYDKARAAWNVAFEQRPAVVVMAESEGDIVAAVRFAREQRLGIGVQGSAHGATVPANGGVLINTARMRGVEVDAAGETAVSAPGAKWADLIPKANAAGLAPLSGSSSDVGIFGYTLGGGSGWLGRRYGYAADSVVSARVVTATGRVLAASATENPDLFWAIRGGTGNFGVVTDLRFRLYPVTHVYGGGIYWPVERAREVSHLYREWAATVPETLTSRLVFAHVPPLPEIPAHLHGKWLVAVQGAFDGPEAEGARLFAPFRKLGGAVEDALGTIPFTAADSIARDPKGPLPMAMHTELLDKIQPELIGYITERVATPASPVAIVEIRHQGGAFAREPATPSAVGVRCAGFWFNAIAAVNPANREATTSELGSIEQAMRPWATGSLFLNGIEEFNASRVRSAYAPATWRRLAEVKRKYDPENTFRFNRNIPPA